MRFNTFTLLLFLPFAIIAQEASPPDNFATKTQTLTTTFTHTVTVSLLATATIAVPLVNNTLPTAGYPTASLGPTPLSPASTGSNNGGNYNVPSPPKETATFIPNDAAKFVIGNHALVGVAGLLAFWAGF